MNTTNTEFIKRAFNIEGLLEKNKVLVIYGPRQVGKTTLVTDYLSKTSLPYTFISGDQLDIAEDISKCDLNLLKKIIGSAKLLVIDEAQKIENIGRALKLIVDNIDDIFVIATGSSSFTLANITSEPLTGRKNVVMLYPISIYELAKQHTEYEIEHALEDYLIYGMYPNIITYSETQKKINRITEIKDSYLFKDILDFQKVKNAKFILALLKLLAFQIGSQVSTSELGKSLGLDPKTIARYLDLLEKTFVLFRLDGFSRNLRKEVYKMSKYYFYDLGIRNALISNFNRFSDRNDQGQLWENFLVMERVKKNAYQTQYPNYYFWRTYDHKEIDFIEDTGGILHGYEFKWRQEKIKEPRMWIQTYPGAKFQLINKNNFLQFVK
jgi:uncharacterized protein